MWETTYKCVWADSCFSLGSSNCQEFIPQPGQVGVVPRVWAEKQTENITFRRTTYAGGNNANCNNAAHCYILHSKPKYRLLYYSLLSTNYDLQVKTYK